MNILKPTLDDDLTDVETRFLINLPETELINAERLLYWIQEGHWFYEDFYADHFPHLAHVSFPNFVKLIFSFSSIFSNEKNDVNQILNHYRKYKSRIPVCGGIIMNSSLSKVLLVCSWNGNSWTFPRGKLNESESSLNCAKREIYEETGFDISDYVDMNNEKSVDKLVADDGNITLFFIPGLF